jgi:hypothetical protein
MQYCVNGIVGSLGTLARMSAPPAAHSYSYRSSLNGPRAMGRVAVPPPRPASAFFGQGCDPGAVPAADELPIIKQIESLQAARTAARAVCDRRYKENISNSTAAGIRAQCRRAANQTFTQQIQEKQDQLAALCAAKSAGLVSSEPSISIMEEEDLPMQTQPVDDEPPVTEELPAGNGKLSTAMMLAIGAGVLMVAGTGIYWLTRRR